MTTHDVVGERAAKLPQASSPGEWVLVVDDESSVLRIVEDVLANSGYRVLTTASTAEAISFVERHPIELVIADISMPEMSGLELIDAIHAIRPSCPVLLCSGHGDTVNLTEGLNRGAAGFIAKPFGASDLRDRVRAVLGRIHRSEADLRERLLAPSVAKALANAVEVRDASMEGHTDRLAALALAIGRRQRLSPHDLEILEVGAVLHDIGKIGVPDEILLRAGPITPEERAIIETHTVIGDQMLLPLGLLEAVRPIVRHHHERWDGNGYPDQLLEDETPLLARIVAIADSVEAMSGRRPYRAALGLDGVVRELAHGRGKQWDPELTDAALELIASGQICFGPLGMQIAPDENC